MLKAFYIWLTKSRLRRLEKYHRVAWELYGDDHPRTAHWKRQYYTCTTEAIKTLENW